MENELKILWDLLTAFGVGLLIGIERGWKGRIKEEGDRVAGIRTFALTGILGGIVGRLSMLMGDWLVAAAFLSFAAVVAIAHFVGARESEDIGFTTSVALLITFSLGIWAVFGSHVYIFSVAVLVVALLGYKPELHKWIGNIETEEIYAGIKLLVISVILLPLLPNQGYGPFEALNPYWLWWMVVLITGLSFVGYVAISHFGDRIGVLLTALTGGLASSTAVTLSLAHMAKRTRVSNIFMAGVLIASAIMFIRVVIEVAVVNPELLYTLWIPMLVMFVVTLIGMFWLWQPKSDDEGKEKPPLKLDNPFQISTALKFGILLGVVLLLAEAMKEWFGDEGIYILSIVSGLMDVDAITLSLSKMAIDDLNEKTAVAGIVLATTSNTLVKGIMFAFLTDIKVSLKLLFVMAGSGLAGILTIFFL
ncbi:MAG TPA: MgtC/SapB family protein [Balneolaceae bacterium]|nr:MgtC/SapB family protein [Balneolaceae bacterium]